MDNPNTTVAAQSGGESLAACWRHLPDKGLFFGLLAAWLALFHFLGNSTFGYVDTPSLFGWMFNAYAGSNREWAVGFSSHPIGSLSKLMSGDESYSFLIPLVVLWLFWWKRGELLAVARRTWWPGLILVVLALALHIAGYMVQQPRVCIVALFTGIYGLMGLVWGAQWLRATFFPFFLFAFMVPFGSLTEPITFPLRLLVSKIVVLIGNPILGFDIQRNGTLLFNEAGRYQYEVAAACSGIRSLMAIAALATIYAFMFFRSNAKRAVLIGSAIPLAVIGNTFRMMAIVLAAEFGGQEIGAAVHESGFWSLLPYIPAMVGLMFLGRWFEKMEAKSGPTPPPPAADLKAA